MKTQILISTLVAVLLIPSVVSGIEIGSWGTMLDTVREDDAMAPHCAKIVELAREAAAKPIVKRAMTLAEVGQHRTSLDGRANALEDAIRETFALAMSDFSACNTLAGELPLLAAAFRITGEEIFRERVIAQLEEMSSWSPLQRPGWTLYHPGARLPADGRDGNWLATGCGVRAIGDALELLPDGAVGEALREKLGTLLETEIASIQDDWRTKRPWFVSSNNAITNQWVLPTEGLVRACLILGKEDHREAYELGVRNMMQALDAHGPKGEFEEGIGYASFTVSSMLHTERAMAANGDRRALDHPFLKNFPTWLVEHFQPGDMVVNCFDSGAARGGANRSRPLLSLLAVCTGDPVARWALTYQTQGPSDTLAGLAARSLPLVENDATPPLFAHYERAARVNWRNNWQSDGDGVWVRGGHRLDQHDHCDRGHVNLIANGRCILIEAGTPYYSHPLMGSHFSSGVGHNVLQIGTLEPTPVDSGTTQILRGWQQRGVVAPIKIKKLNARGGDVSVEVNSGYEGLKRWGRDVTWQSDTLVVCDTVELADGSPDTILFRWHLGTNDDVSITQAPRKWQVEYPDAKITIESLNPLTVTQLKMPDNTVNTVSDDDVPDPLHTCLIVRSVEAVQGIEIATEVSTK